ncbi:MAG: hypothetical protein ACREXX_09435 [Gammaproteobacteria bacterium]
MLLLIRHSSASWNPGFLLCFWMFTDQSGAKKRPVVTVFSSGYNANRRIMTTASQVRTPVGFGEALVARLTGRRTHQAFRSQAGLHDHRARPGRPHHGQAFGSRSAHVARSHRAGHRLSIMNGGRSGPSRISSYPQEAVDGALTGYAN